MTESKNYDIVSIGAHPDDVEVGSGGVIIKMSQAGYRCGIIYLTRGEMGTGGTPEVRAGEAKAAADIMGADLLETLDLGDTRVVDTPDNRYIVAELLRRYRPKIVFAPWPRGGHGMRQMHADHLAAGNLVMHARYYATFKKLPVEGEPYRVPALFHYFLPHDETPDFVVDITDQFDRWIEALKAHGSQFVNPEKSKNRDYMWFLETMARSFGHLIGVKYGQGFKIGEPLSVADPFDLIPGEKRWL